MMPSSRSRSPTPNRARSRSRSPPRRPAEKKSKGGFRWKEKPRRDDNAPEVESGILKRGYRDRSPRRDSHRDRSPRRYSYRDRSPRPDSDRRDRGRKRDGEGRERGGDGYKGDRGRDDKPSERRDPFADSAAKTAEGASDRPREKKHKEKKSKPQPIASGEEMIIVNVNDRLGTKAAIPCLASDLVGLFKAQVAARIGRKPHEIMLKRQGERPFKDQLTLEDYGVSNGVQLDLELDTGD